MATRLEKRSLAIALHEYKFLYTDFRKGVEWWEVIVAFSLCVRVSVFVHSCCCPRACAR